LVHFLVIWYIFCRFGMLCREKSGNPDLKWLDDAFHLKAPIPSRKSLRSQKIVPMSLHTVLSSSRGGFNKRLFTCCLLKLLLVFAKIWS
jgi:hypothetical protein